MGWETHTFWVDDDIVATDEEHGLRAVLRPEEDAEQPDGDCYGWVFSLSYRYGWRVSLLHDADRSDSPEHGLVDALNRWGSDWDTVERYLRMFHDVMSVDMYDERDGGKLVELVTREVVTAWGTSPEDMATSADLSDWRAWSEGKVYGCAVQRHDAETDDWHDVDMPVWGLYGREYAEQHAAEELARVADETRGE